MAEKIWNDERDQQLKLGVGLGLTAPVIAEFMGMETEQIQNRKKRLKLKSPLNKSDTKWTDERDAHLEVALELGLTRPVIAKILEVDPKTIQNRMKARGLKSQSYTPAEALERARNMLRATNMQIKDIAAEVGISFKSFGSVYKRHFGIPPSEEERPDPLHPAVETALDDIEANFNQLGYTASSETIAQDFGISGRQLRDLFKEHANVNMKTFIMQRRMAEAKKLLVQKPHMSLNEVGRSCGYKDASSLLQHFPKYEGMEMGEFRARHVVETLQKLEDVMETLRSGRLTIEAVDDLRLRNGFESIREMDAFVIEHDYATLLNYAVETGLIEPD